MKWNIDHIKKNNIIILTPDEKMLSETPEDFIHYIKNLIKLNETKIIINLNKAEWLNSVGIGALANTHKEITKNKGKLILCNLTDKIITVLKISYLIRLFEITKTESDALDKFNEQEKI